MRAASDTAGAADDGDSSGVRGDTHDADYGDDNNPHSEDDEAGPAHQLPDRLVTELTSHRTLALRDALARNPDIAFLSVLHNLALAAFFTIVRDSCLEIRSGASSLPTTQAPGLADSPSAKGIDARHESWRARLPDNSDQLWDALLLLTQDERSHLFAHCAALAVNAVYLPHISDRRSLAHADILAHALSLDPAAAGWVPTVDNYLGRVTKARILDAVREAKGESAVQLLEHLKKPEMAKEAARLLADSGWLPEPLRAPAPTARLPAFLATDTPVEGESELGAAAD